MRKIVLLFGKVPASIRAAAKKALAATTWMVKKLESREAVTLTDLIPGNADNELRMALLQVLHLLEPALEQLAKNKAMREAFAGTVGAEVTRLLDGKQDRLSNYKIWFEKVYQEQKA